MKLTQEEVLARFRKAHGDRYAYSKVEYENSKTPVTIICPAHGEFQQRPSNHMQGKGCAACAAEARRGKAKPVAIVEPVEEPVATKRRLRSKPIQIGDVVFDSISSASRETGIRIENIRYRLWSQSKKFTEYSYVNEADNPWRG